MTRRALLIPILAVLFLAAPAIPVFAAEGEYDRWYALYVGEKKSGHVHESLVKAEEDGRVVWITTSDSSFAMNRMGQLMTVVQKSTKVEDADGTVLRTESSMSAGTMAQKTTVTVKDGKVELTQLGRARTMDYPAGALGPAAIIRMCTEAGLEPGKKFDALTFSEEAPTLSVTQSFVVGEQEKKDVLGRVLMLQRVTITNSLMPTIPTRAWVDRHWNPLVTESDIPGLGTFRGFVTEKQVALSKSEPAEVFTTTLIAPDRAIPGARTLKKAVLRLGKKDGPLLELYEGEGQKVTSKMDGKLEVEILNEEPGADFAAATLPFSTESFGDLLKAVPFIECDDPEVVKLAKEAVGDEKDALKAARKIEEYARKKISKKSLNVGFASAAEVARTLEGDCTEHGVFCAAIARAVGMPARVVTGLVYIGPGQGFGDSETGVFGFHMWTEVMIAKDRWYAIDAAVGDYDATHISIVKSGLSEVNPQIEMVLGILPVLGTLTIEVIEPK